MSDQETKSAELDTDPQGRVQVLRCRLEVKSEILGNSIFWEGSIDETAGIRTLPGRRVAEAVFRSGRPQSWGMWYGFPCG